jgi:predicted transcriptional regulator
MTLVAVSLNGIRVGEDSPHAKYTDNEIDSVFRLLDEGYSFADVARMMDMPKSTVWAIAKGLMRATVVDRWEKRLCRN